jgi:hypothetical protein
MELLTFAVAITFALTGLASADPNKNESGKAANTKLIAKMGAATARPERLSDISRHRASVATGTAIGPPDISHRPTSVSGTKTGLIGYRKTKTNTG